VDGEQLSLLQELVTSVHIKRSSSDRVCRLQRTQLLPSLLLSRLMQHEQKHVAAIRDVMHLQ
jgi:hypothetical protein